MPLDSQTEERLRGVGGPSETREVVEPNHEEVVGEGTRTGRPLVLFCLLGPPWIEVLSLLGKLADNRLRPGQRLRQNGVERLGGVLPLANDPRRQAKASRHERALLLALAQADRRQMQRASEAHPP